MRLPKLSPASAALAVLLVAFQGSAAFAQTAPQPQAKAFKVGALDLVALHDRQFVLPNDTKTFGIGHSPADVAAVLKAAGAPTDNITLSVDALLVKTGKRLVLIDTGAGGALQASLSQAGYTPDAITDVLLTHTHGDHVGGLVKDGKLAFPNATIRMSRPEWTWLKTQANMADLVKAISGKVKAFKVGAKVAPRITSVALKGHTPGHVGYRIASGKEQLLDMGDTAHSSILSLAEPKWPIGFDNDEATGEKNRVDTLARLAKSGETVFAPHFPFPGVGRIEAEGDHYVWKPTLTAQ